ncbi:MAG: hypothetical protein QXX08_00955 [Candidatus Bathyarchaeia archaeon]
MTFMEEYYSRPNVQTEIYEFCKGRWVALHCVNESGKLVFRRYAERKPIKVDDSRNLLKFLKNCKTRSIYATANVYGVIRRFEDVYDISNIRYCTPTWDIDSTISNWQKTVTIAKEIVFFLNSQGIEKSTYIKWSGNGCHVHIHEKAFSKTLLEKYHPLDLAYSLVEYVNSKLALRFLEMSSGEIAVENKMDPTRVFTCPLSLHRELDAVCICMKPEQLDDFTLDWINPQNFRHNTSWRDFRTGEIDELAERAYKSIGGYSAYSKRRHKKTKPIDKQIMEWLEKD